MKKGFRYRISFVCLFILTIVTGEAFAQQIDQMLPGVHQRTPSTPQTGANGAEPSDPLGRSTPHGTVFGFLRAAQNNKYKEATQYLQLSKNERDTEGERIARQLHSLMDNAFVGRVGKISDERGGSVQIGVPQDHEQIGVFRLNDSEVDVDLVRVSDPTAGDIWLFSSKTLTDVPNLYSQIETSEVDSRLPRFLATDRVLHTPLWRLAAFLLLIPLSFGLAWGFVKLLRGVLRIVMRRWHYDVLEDVHNSLQGPATLALTVAFHQIGVSFLGLALLIRTYYQRAAGLLVVAGVAWLVFRLINCWAERARRRALRGSGYRSSSLVLLAQRILKVAAGIVTVLMMISILGYQTTTVLAGLGVGSIAIAFAAQKTLENLFGGVSVLGDEVIRVGDTCRIADRVGVVKDISLRSTRIRMLDRTELSVPNGQLAEMNVENLSRRDKHLFRTNIGLRCNISPDQLRSLLAEIRTVLYEHPKVDPNVARVTFVGFGESSLDVEIHCLILTTDWNEFLVLREELLLRIMEQVANAGAEFAFPSRTLYIAQDQRWEHQQAGSLEKNAFEPRGHS
jgi:MscS family membrane protein